MMNLFWLSFTLFLVMDSFGSIPVFIAVLKDLPEKKQYHIIFRELIIALIIIVSFYFAGAAFLRFLQISQNTIAIAGGIILFLLGLKMVFPPDKDEVTNKKIKEPFIVPLAIPLLAGPAVLATVMLFSHQVSNHLIMLGAILIAWVGTVIVLLPSPWIIKKLGDKGIIAIERLMGLVLILMAIQMFMNGIKNFVLTLNQ